MPAASSSIRRQTCSPEGQRVPHLGGGDVAPLPVGDPHGDVGGEHGALLGAGDGGKLVGQLGERESESESEEDVNLRGT